MDTGTIHRLAIICKDYYVNRTIDDLFIFAGAERQWWLKITESKGSERIDNFYGWIEGIKTKNPNALYNILDKVAIAICRNEQVPEIDRSAINEAFTIIEYQKETEKGFQLDPFLATLARMLASVGLTREVAIVTFAEPVLDLLENDYGQEYYLLYLHVPHRLYTQIEGERKRCEKNISDRVDDLFRGIPGPKIHSVEVVPQIMGDNKWREKAIAWLAGEKINNQGRVRSDNVAPRISDGLLFRSQPEINLYNALKAVGISFAPLPVFVRGGQQYRRIEPDFVIVKSGVMLVVEVDGDTYHHETPAEADNRTLEFIKIYGILPAPKRKERTAMLRYAIEREKANQILNLTSLTVEQFEQLVDPFEQAFVRHMHEWTMEGKPRTARAYTPYANSPLPTAEDRLLFLLSYLKVASLQVAHGAAFGMTQPNANKWLHILLVVLHQTLRDLGDAPARHLVTLRERLVALQADEQHEEQAARQPGDDADTAPLFIMMVPNARSCARTTMLNRKRIIAARKSVIM